MGYSSKTDPKIQCGVLLDWLTAYIPQQSKILDLGCGNKWYHPYIKSHIISVDAYEPNHPNIVMDLSKSFPELPNNSFDIVLLLDVVEHLEKDRAKELIDYAIRIAGVSVILLTPLIWDDNLGGVRITNNEYNRHQCLFTLEDFDQPWKRIYIKELNKYFLGVYENEIQPHNAVL